jgi:HSP20 family protein
MNRTRKTVILTAVLTALIVAVGVESVVILRMQKRVNALQPGSAATLAAPQRNAPGGAWKPLKPRAPWNDEFLKDPFGNVGGWDPLKEMQSMQERINQMFGGAFNRFREDAHYGNLFNEFVFSPSIDLEDKGDYYLATVDLPGADESRIAVKVEGQVLTVTGSIDSSKNKKDRGAYLKEERYNGRFERSITLPEPVDGGNVTTETDKGVLRIRIPKEKQG